MIQQDLVPVWYGVLSTEYQSDYFEWRTALSDAAYFGRWNQLLQILGQEKAMFKQNWVNCIKMGSSALLS